METLPSSYASARGTAAASYDAAARSYLSGFGNEHASEALAGALPLGRNTPQRAPYGLYPECLTGTSFTAPRADNRRTWTYRLRPSVLHRPFRPLAEGRFLTAPIAGKATPNQLRWSPFDVPEVPADFLSGLITLGANGDAEMQAGVALHVYLANRDMTDTAFSNGDGDFLVVPQQGRLVVRTELGVLAVRPGEVLLLPRGIKFSVALPDGPSRGYVCENYGRPFRLPELGPIGSNGLANARDFLAPRAAYEDRPGAWRHVTKLAGTVWEASIDHSPFDVVAWYGTLVPYKYDLANFNTIGSLSYDHPDPSLYTVLTSPSEVPGVANVDFCALTPRWQVAENTFRPPFFHRNVMTEFMGLISGAHEAKAGGFLPGGASLHNAGVAHGPDAVTFDRASTAPEAPQKLDGSTAFMFETRYPLRVSLFAMEAAELQHDYLDCWRPLRSRFDPDRH